MSFIQIKYDALKRGCLCDHCLGRLVSLAFKGHPVEKVGAALRKADSDETLQENLSKKLEILESKECFVCRGLFLKREIAEELVLDKMKEQEFETFLMGCILPKGVQDAEESLWSIVGCEHCEPIKREINRSLGKSLEKNSGKKVDFDNPDIIFTIDFENNRVSKQLNSVFIYGNYTKLIRGIPQTKWPCRECNGKGCKRCDNTGKMYKDSVEEFISREAIPTFGASGAKFHGKGREDIDALMLGKGRPFVLELLEPVKRKENLKELEKKVNDSASGKVQVSGLRFSSKDEVREIKAAESDKKYECLIKCEGVNAEDLKLIEEKFKDVQLMQCTPTRVSHRRADKCRKKMIYSVSASLIEEGVFKAVIKASSGTYIKELISGDGDRTKPSFSEVIGKKCVCEKLDVLEVCE